MTEQGEEKKAQIAIARRRPLTSWRARLVSIIAITATVYHVIVLSDILTRFFNWNIIYVTHRAVSLSFFMLLVFLEVPMFKRANKDSIPWYDIIFALLAYSGCAYIFILYERELIFRFSDPTTMDVIFGTITVVMLLEACRRVIGWIIPALISFFFINALYGNHFPGFLYNRGYPIDRLFIDMYIWDQGIWGNLLHLASTVIFMFIIFAVFLQVSGGDKFFLNLALSLGGRFKGGPAKVAVIASSFFGTLSGSVIANVAGTGSITIPMMKETGVRPRLAAAVEACASTGGMLMPPIMGSAAFVMADFLGISYWSVAVAAFVPAILFYVSLFFMVHFDAARTGMKGLPKETLPSPWKTLFHGWMFILPIVVLVYFIGVLKWDPVKASLYATITLIIVSLFRKETRVTPGKLFKGFEGAANMMIEVMIICAAIGIMVGSIHTTGLGIRLSDILIDFAGGNLFILLLTTAIVSYILGMGLPTTACYILLAVLVAPAIVQMGVPPIAAHLFVLYFGIIGNITPPLCGAVYIASAIAGTPVMRTGFEAMKLALASYMVPFIFVYNPALVAEGTSAELTIAAITAVFGVLFLASGVQGYLIRKTGWPERLLLIAGSVLMMIPGWYSDVIGLFIIMPVVVRQLYAWLVSNRKDAYSTVEIE